MTKQLVRFGTAVMTTLLALWQFRIVVVYLLVSLALAAALRPLVKRLSGEASWCAWLGFYCTWLPWAVSASYSS